MAESEIVPPEQAVATESAADVVVEDANTKTDAQPTTTTTTTFLDENPQEQEPSATSTSSDGDASPDPEAFVNNGLEKWLAAREAWCQKPNTADETKQQTNQERRAIPVDVDGIIDVLFDPRWRGGGGRVKVSLEPPRFPKNVPLPQMIDVLTDLWEAEGLDV